MPKRTYSGPLYDRLVAHDFTIERFAKCIGVERRSFIRVLQGKHCVNKQSRGHAAMILKLTEKEFSALLDEQERYGKAAESWRVFSRFCSYMNFGMLENVADIKLLGIDPEKIQSVRDWCDRMLERLQQSDPVTPPTKKQVTTHVPLPLLTRKLIRPLPPTTGTHG